MDYNKVDAALKSIGIDLKDDVGQFRDLDNVFLELAQTWNSLSRNQQRYIATTAAGSRQQSRFIALMSDYSRTLELVETAQNAQGRSSEQFAKYSDSVEYSVKQLQNTWEQFRVNLANNDFYKNFIDGLNSLLSKISDFESGDWAKFILGWATLGRLVVNSFLTGMQNAISSISPAIQSNFQRISERVSSGTTSWFQNRLMGYRPKKSITSGPEYEAILRQNTIKYNAELANRLSGTNYRIAELERSRAIISSNLPRGYLDSNGNLIESNLPTRRDSHTNLVERYRQEGQELIELQRQKAKIITEVNKEKRQVSGEQAAQAYNERQLAQLTSESQVAIRTQQLYAAGQAAAGAFMSAFTAGMMTDDPGTVFKTAMIGGATAAIPGILNTFTTALSSDGFTTALASAGKAGLWAAVATLIVGGIAFGIKRAKQYIKEQNEQELLENSEYYQAITRQEQLTKIEEERGKAAYKTAAALEKSADAYDSLAAKTKELEELRSKNLLTTEEEERLIEIQNDLAEIAPEIVSYYDKEGNAVIDLKNSYSELIEEKKKLMLIDEQAANKAALGVAQVSLQETINTTKKTIAAAEEVQADPVIQALRNYDYGNRGPSSLKELSIHNPEYYPVMTFELGGGLIIGEQTERQRQRYEKPDRLYQFNATEVEQAGRLLKEALSATSGFESLTNTEDKDVIKTINTLIKEADNSADLVRKLNIAIDTINVDYESLDYAIRAAGNDYLEAGKKELSTRLALQSDFYNKQSDLNVKNMMTDFLLAQIGTSWDQLMENNPQRENESYVDWQNRLVEKAENIISKVKIDDEALSKVFSTSIISVIEQISSGDFDIQEQELMMQKTNETVYDIWQKENEIQIQAYNERLQKVADIFGGQLNTNTPLWKAIGSNGDLVEAIMNSLHSENFVNIAEQWIQADRQGEFAKNISGLSAKEITEIFNINWGDVAVAEYSDQIKALAKAVDKNPEDVEKIVKTLGLFDAVSYSSDQLEDEVKQRMEVYKKYDKKIQAFKTAGESWAKDGKVSAAGIEALYDQGFNVSKLINSDLQLDVKAVKEEIENTLNLELQSLEIKKAQTIELMKQYKIVSQLDENSTYTAKQLGKMGLTPDTISKLFTKNDSGLFIPSTALASSQYTAFEDELNNYEDLTRVLTDRMLSFFYELDSVAKGISDEAEDRADKIAKAEEEVKDAYEDVLKKQQDVIDKQKALDETLYGTPYHKNKTEELYNYTTALDVYTKSIEEAKEALDDLRGADPAELIDEWMSNTHQKAANLTATNNRYESAINATRSTLENELVKYLSGLGRGVSTNVGDYFYYDPTLGRYGINYGALNNASMNDDLKDFIEEQVDLMNQYSKSIKDNQKELKTLEKDFIEYQRKARDNYIDVQEEIAKVLEEYYKQQVEDKKEMYDALEEADNEYLDALQKAIDKERKLRDKEEKWSQLATKEKKLSLLQRDTSGSNRKTVQQLQKDITKDRQSLLDDSVDSIVENLKELYETQKETRDMEIEYQEAVLENANYIAEANSLLQGWKTVDEMREWMWEHTQDIDKMSDEAIEKMTEDWEQMFDTITIYNEMSQREITSIFEVSSEEVKDIVVNTSETLTSESTRALNEVSSKVSESIQSAEQAVSDAMRALADSQTTYNQKIRELNELLGEMGSKIAGIDLSNLTQNETPPSPVQQNYSSLDFNSSGNVKITNIPAAIPNNEAIANYLKNTYGEYIYGYLSGDGWYAFNDEASMNNFIMGLPISQRGGFRRYKKGGLVNYTGLAQVDGTPSAPEAFLDAEDTANLGQLTDILSSLAAMNNNGGIATGMSASIGDTSVQMNVYVESIATPAQVDYLLDRMEERFVEAANPIGTSVILRQ